MKILIQRVKQASVTISNTLYSQINKGYLIFLGIEKDDSEDKIEWLINKILNLRIFENDEGKMTHSIIDVQGEILLVSQFTLCGNCKKGNRPSFDNAMPPQEAQILYEKFVQELSQKIRVKTGVFGAMMDIALINDGPVTFMIEK
ncbi:D-tyrosyl-tRNA(Tyr) deacylase [bacterium]|nr:D-tyrosyl-tRNA(Tyr) deacylase [bacterium]